jgi:hypothetical protein
VGLIEIVLGVVIAIAVGAAVALTNSGTTATEFWIARALFLVGAASLIAAYVCWIWNDPPDPSWRVLLGALAGVLALAGTTEAIFWVNFRERQVFAWKVGLQTNEFWPIIAALRSSRQQLDDQEEAREIVREILEQYDQHERAITNFDQHTESADFKDRLAAAQRTIANLKALLENVGTIGGQRGDVVVKTALNTFRVTFAVPTTIAPTIVFPNLPKGLEAHIVEKSTIGYTVMFTPSTVPFDLLVWAGRVPAEPFGALASTATC